jgi:hypothetical protein
LFFLSEELQETRTSETSVAGVTEYQSHAIDTSEVVFDIADGLVTRISMDEDPGEVFVCEAQQEVICDGKNEAIPARDTNIM